MADKAAGVDDALFADHRVGFDDTSGEDNRPLSQTYRAVDDSHRMNEYRPAGLPEPFAYPAADHIRADRDDGHRLRRVGHLRHRPYDGKTPERPSPQLRVIVVDTRALHAAGFERREHYFCVVSGTDKKNLISLLHHYHPFLHLFIYLRYIYCILILYKVK